MKKLLLFLATVATLATARGEDPVYLFTYFVGNGEDGLHLAWSADGFDWKTLAGGKSILAPAVGKDRLMRDPCVARGPDGTYQLVWTSGWWDREIGHASTKDFITWSEQQAIPVMAHESTARNAWAPEVAWDPSRGDYLVFWATTIPGRFSETKGGSEDELNHRIYFTTTKDWKTFTETRLFCDPGFSVIDATLLPANGRYALIVKNETRFPEPEKNLRLAWSDDPRGPWKDFEPPFSPAGLWAEGPTAIKIGADYFVYFDAYAKKHYGALRSRDLMHWEDVTSGMRFPDEGTRNRLRHGTVIAVPMSVIDGIEKRFLFPKN